MCGIRILQREIVWVCQPCTRPWRVSSTSYCVWGSAPPFVPLTWEGSHGDALGGGGKSQSWFQSGDTVMWCTSSPVLVLRVVLQNRPRSLARESWRSNIQPSGVRDLPTAFNCSMIAQDAYQVPHQKFQCICRQRLTVNLYPHSLLLLSE